MGTMILNQQKDKLMKIKKIGVNTILDGYYTTYASILIRNIISYLSYNNTLTAFQEESDGYKTKRAHKEIINDTILALGNNGKVYIMSEV